MCCHFTFNSLQTFFRYLAASALLLLIGPDAGQLRAQPGPPGAGALREVTRLAKVPEPPGGLIPYRAGGLWGYADTTGRVVIRPCIPWENVQSAVLFDHGFAAIPAYLAPGAVATLTGQPLSPEVGLLLLNARGEVLPLASTQAAVLQSDSSLLGVLRTRAHGQVVLWQLQHEYYQKTGFGAAVFRRLQARDDLPVAPQEPTPTLHQEKLGAHRVMWARDEAGVRDADELFALADDHGRRLTAYQFSRIEAFSDGLAVVTRRTKKTEYYGYVDTTGRVVVPLRYENASAFRHGRALVQQHERDAIIDRRGRYLLAPQSHRLYGPDEGGYIMEIVPNKATPASPDPADSTLVRYLPPPGQPPIALRVSAGDGFRQGRAQVRLGQRAGLIDSLGRWVTPLAYERLLSPPTLRSEPNEVGQLDKDDLPNDADEWRAEWREVVGFRSYAQRPDPRYLVARRQGKFGIVARRSGREVVPASYDSVLVNPCYGVVIMQRAGLAYLVSLSTGRAVAGTFEGVIFLMPQGKRFYLTDPAKGAWALADTTGQLATAWLPGTGYPTAQGWMLSEEAAGWTLRTAAGKLAYTSPTRIEQPAWTAQWAEVQQATKNYWRSGNAEYWELPLPGASSDARGLFLVHDEAGRRLRWLDAHLREVGHHALPATAATLPGAPTVMPLPGYWRYVGRRLDNYRPTINEKQPFQLLTDTGQLLPAPAGAPWAFFFSFDYPRAWYRHGVLPTTLGYITRGGRRLWQ